MKLQRLIPCKERDYSNLSENERLELYYLAIMYHGTKRLPRKRKKRMKRLLSKTTTRIEYYTQCEIDASLPF